MKLQAVEALQAAAFENSPEARCLKDDEFVIQEANQAFCAHLGLSKADIVGKTDFELFAEAQARALRRFDEALAQSRQALCQEVVWEGPHGEERWEVHGTPLLGSAGEFLGLQHSLRDCAIQQCTERAPSAREAESSGAQAWLLWHLTEVVPVMLWTALPDGSVEYVTEHCVRYTGQPAGTLGGLHTLHPDDREALRASFSACLSQAADWTSEPFRICRHDGEYRWHVAQARPATDETGKITRWFGVTTEVHEATVASRAQAHSEARLRRLLECVPAMMWTARPDGSLDHVSEQFAAYFGRTPEEILQAGRGSLVHATPIHPDDATEVRQAAQHCLASGASFAKDYRVQDRDGAGRWLNSQAMANRDENGVITGWFGISVDITERLEAESAVRESEAWLRQLTEALPALVWTILPDGRMEFMTQQLIEFTGRPLEELLGHGFLDSIHPQDRGWMIEYLKHATREAGIQVTPAYRFRRHDGEYRWYISQGTTSFNEQGEPIRWFGVSFDITEQQEVKDALERYTELLEAVRSVQEAYISPGDTEHTMSLFLDLVLRLTGSQMGYVSAVEFKTGADGSRTSQLTDLAITDIHWESDTELASAELKQRFHLMATRCALPALQGETVIHNALIDCALQSVLPSGHPVVENFMVLPMRFAGEVVGVLALANCEGGFSDEVVRNTTPLVRACAAMIQDLQRRACEQAYLDRLQQSERGYRQLFENMEQGVVYRDRNGQGLRANPAAERILETTTTDICAACAGGPYWRLTDEALKPLAEAQLPHMVALATGKPVLDTMLGLQHSTEDRVKWLLVDAVPEFISGGPEPDQVFAIFTDITARSETQIACQELSDRLQYALDATSEGFWDWNIQTGQVYWSDQWIASLGYTREEVGTAVSFWREIVHPYDARRTSALLQAHLAGETPRYTCENRLRMKSGAYRDNLDQGRVVAWDNEGKPLRMVGTSADITERNRANAELRHLSGRLLAAQEAERGRIAAELHDEVGQRLTGLSLLLESSAGLAPELFERRLELARTTTLQLMDNIRQLARGLRPPLLNELGLLRALEVLVEQYINQTGIAVAFHHEGSDTGLPELTGLTLYRIVQECLTNIARHAEPQAVQVELLLSADRVTLTVVDDGKGFDISKPRLESMGLKGMEERARLLGGVLEIRSKPSAGTQVKATLPGTALHVGEAE